MILDSLRLLDFRNFRELEIEPGGRCAAIWGPNGRGKTNLLEAIFLLGTTRSHRTRKDPELIRFGGDVYHVAGSYRRSNGGRMTLSVAYEKGGRKKGRVDGKEVSKMSSLVGRCGVVLVSPEDVEITKGEPERRRQFLDLTLCSIDPIYLRSLQELGRILRQRSSLLRDTWEPDRARMLDPWDRQLAAAGWAITEARARAMEELAPLVEEAYSALGGGEQLVIGYRPGIGREPVSEEDVLQKIVAVRDEDLRLRRTTIGPHRDDLDLELDGRSIRAYGSRGQHRTAVLALKLAAVRLMAQRLGEEPILLLDDVFTELDASRAERLATRLDGAGQVFATGTGRAELDRFFPGVEHFKVEEEGRVVRGG